MQVIKKILIANRGEIARRVNRTARSMGYGTLAVYTAEEKDACHVLEAEEAVLLGSGPLSETYLNIDLLVRIALDHGCNAIHPGYGFLSENALFAEACQRAGILFIGPSPAHIRLMGNKKEARAFVEKLGVPLPFSLTGKTIGELAEMSLPYPLIIKAVAGGGGKGMRLVSQPQELAEAWESAGREAESYFGNAELYLEQYIQDARHIEVQVLGDQQGNIVHLYERECSIQRRHQKIVEEAPSVTLPEEVREKLLEVALHITRSMHYHSAGTLEFLFDRELNFYFLEMNTRIQVEHPVTECITGVDIVREQIRIAEGKSLSMGQKDISIRGHAIECRVYAEDPFQGFMPSSGEMQLNQMPDLSGIRLDSSVSGAGRISGTFDPMIAKVTAHGSDREGAIEKLHGYLAGCVVHGIHTNLRYLTMLMDEQDFQLNRISTRYCEEHQQILEEKYLKAEKAANSSQFLAATLISLFNRSPDSDNIWQTLGPWRNLIQQVYRIGENVYPLQIRLDNQRGMIIKQDNYSFYAQYLNHQGPELLFRIGDKMQRALISWDGTGNAWVSMEKMSLQVTREDIPQLSRDLQKVGRAEGNGHIQAPLNGRVVRLNVRSGDMVRKGGLLLLIESMKMENRIVAPADAEVSEILVSEGDQVAGKELLMKLKMHN